MLGVPAVAAANPDAQACAGKAEGQACALMKVVKPPGGEMQRKTVPGACRSDQCCELDYSKGSPPQSVCSACLVCKEGPADASPAPASSAGPSGEPPRAQGEDPPALPPNEKSGCRADPLAPVSVATLGLLGLLLLPRRRA